MSVTLVASNVLLRKKSVCHRYTYVSNASNHGTQLPHISKDTIVRYLYIMHMRASRRWTFTRSLTWFGIRAPVEQTKLTAEIIEV